MRRRVIVTTAVIGMLTVGLAGCTATDAPDRSPASASAAPESDVTAAAAAAAASAASTASAAAAGPAPAAGTVGAETDIRTPDGSISVHIRVVATGNDEWVVQTSDYQATGPGHYALFLRQFDEAVGDTIEDGVSFGYDNWGSAGTDNADGPPAQVSLVTAGIDPGFLRDAVLTTMDDGFRVIAVAPLTWSLPERYADLRVVDSGSRDGATGTVELEDGVPRWYVVAPGDTLGAVSKRFGVTAAELDYLGARRAWDFAGGEPLRSGMQLNLDRSKR